MASAELDELIVGGRRGAARVVVGQPRRVARRLAGPDQEGRHGHHADLAAGGRRGPVLRLDRRAGPQARSGDLLDPVHPSSTAQRLVTTQRRPRGPAGSTGANAARRPRCGRRREKRTGGGRRPTPRRRKPRHRTTFLRPSRPSRPPKPCSMSSPGPTGSLSSTASIPPERGADPRAKDRRVRRHAGPP